MATVLAIETSDSACSLAVLRDGTLTERHEILPRSHTQFILPLIDDLLVQTGIKLADLDAIAFGRGPGSFTGLRVCAAVVQGLAFAADLPCIPVSTLQALALTAIQDKRLAEGSDILCCIDARMDEVYCAHYRNERGLPVAEQEERLCAPEAVDWQVEAAVLVGSGWNYESRIRSYREDSDKTLIPRAGAVAELGTEMLSRGKFVPVEQALPHYIRDDVAWR